MSSGLLGAELLVYNVALGAVFAVGLVGNCLVIGVICRQRGSRSVTSVYLGNLAVADALHLLSIPPLIHTSAVSYWAWNQLACKIYYMLHYTNFTVSVYIITAMSFDRYKAVVSPFTSAKFRNKTFATAVLVALWITGAIVISPVYLYARTQQYNATGPEHCTHSQIDFDDGEMGNATTLSNATTGTSQDVSIRLRSFFTNPAYFARYMFVTGCVLPGLMLICFYALIVRKLYVMKLARNSSGQAQERFEKVTLLVGAVVAFYVVCCLPHWIHVNVSLSVPDSAEPSYDFIYWMTVSSHVTTLLGYMSSAGNPVLYAFLNEPFRASLREFLGIAAPGGPAGNRGPAGGAVAAHLGAAGAAAAATGAAGGAAELPLLCGGPGGVSSGDAVGGGGGGDRGAGGSPSAGMTTFNFTSLRDHQDDLRDLEASGGTKETAMQDDAT